MPNVNFQQPINTAAHLLNEYAAGNRNFEKVELGEANLPDVNLRGADFSYADLSSANLMNANLRGCDFSYADLSQANLQNADLRGAMLFSTDLRQANLQGVQLEQADCDHNTHFPADFDFIKAGVKMSDESQ